MNHKSKFEFFKTKIETILVVGIIVISVNFFYKKLTKNIVLTTTQTCQHIEYPLNQILDPNLEHKLTPTQLKKIYNFYCRIRPFYSEHRLKKIINSIACELVSNCETINWVDTLSYPPNSLRGGGKGSGPTSGMVSPSAAASGSPRASTPRVSGLSSGGPPARSPGSTSTLSPRISNVRMSGSQSPSSDNTSPRITRSLLTSWPAPRPFGQQLFAQVTPRDNIKTLATIDTNSFQFDSNPQILPKNGAIFPLKFQYLNTKNPENVVQIDIKITMHNNEHYYEPLDIIIYSKPHVLDAVDKYFHDKGYLPKTQPLVIELDKSNAPYLSHTAQTVLVSNIKKTRAIDALLPQICSVDHIEENDDGRWFGIAKNAANKYIEAPLELEKEHPHIKHSRKNMSIPEKSETVLVTKEENTIRRLEKFGFFRIDVKPLFDPLIANKSYATTIFEMQENNREIVKKESQNNPQFMAIAGHMEDKLSWYTSVPDLDAKYQSVDIVQTIKFAENRPNDLYPGIKKADEVPAMLIKNQIWRMENAIEKTEVVDYATHLSPTEVPELPRMIKSRIDLFTKISTSIRLYFTTFNSGEVVITPLLREVKQLETQWANRCERTITSYSTAFELQRLPACQTPSVNEDIQSAEMIVLEFRKMFSDENDFGLNNDLSWKTLTMELSSADAQQIISNMKNHPRVASFQTIDEKTEYLKQNKSATYGTLENTVSPDLPLKSFTLEKGTVDNYIFEKGKEVKSEITQSSKSLQGSSTSESPSTEKNATSESPSTEIKKAELKLDSIKKTASFQSEATVYLKTKKSQLRSHLIELTTDEIQLKSHPIEVTADKNNPVPKLNLEKLNE